MMHSNCQSTPCYSWDVVKLDKTCWRIWNRQLKRLKNWKGSTCCFSYLSHHAVERQPNWVSWRQNVMLQSDATPRGLNENFILHCRTVMVGLAPKNTRPSWFPSMTLSSGQTGDLSAALVQHLLIGRSLRACQEVDVYSRSSRNN